MVDQEPDDSGGATSEVSPSSSDPPAESKWIRLRKSCVIRTDKIVQVRIQRRDDDYFLEVRADRDISLPVADRSAAVAALEAIHAGADDISQWVEPRPFMKD